MSILNSISESLARFRSTKIVQDKKQAAEAIEHANPNTPEGQGVHSALGAIYNNTIKTRKEFLHKQDLLRPFYIVDAILSQIAEDALTPDVTTGEVVQFESSDEKLSEELEALQDEFNFDQIANDIVIDILLAGEHTLRVEAEDGVGITKIKDDVDQTKLVALYEAGFPSLFLKNKQYSNTPEVVDSAKYAHFVLGRNRLRISVPQELGSSVGVNKVVLPDALPSYARIGKPLFFGVLSKLQELMLLEALVPASKLNQVISGSIVELQVPEGTPPKRAFELSRKYQELLNRKVGINRDDDELSVSDIIGAAGRIKVIPSYGGNRGGLTELDVKSPTAVSELHSEIEENRKIVCTSIGFPPEFLFGGDNKAELLKRYSRYVRKLKNVQTSIANGFMQIIITHLTRKGIEFNLRDIKISFRNEQVNVDELDKLEFQDAVFNIVGNIFRFITEVGESDNEQFKAMIDENGFQKWLHEITSGLMGTANFIKPVSENPEEPEPDETPDAEPGEEPEEPSDSDDKDSEPKSDDEIQTSAEQFVLNEVISDQRIARLIRKAIIGLKSAADEELKDAIGQKLALLSSLNVMEDGALKDAIFKQIEAFFVTK